MLSCKTRDWVVCVFSWPFWVALTSLEPMSPKKAQQRVPWPSGYCLVNPYCCGTCICPALGQQEALAGWPGMLLFFVSCSALSLMMPRSIDENKCLQRNRKGGKSPRLVQERNTHKHRNNHCISKQARARTALWRVDEATCAADGKGPAH